MKYKPLILRHLFACLASFWCIFCFAAYKPSAAPVSLEMPSEPVSEAPIAPVKTDLEVEGSITQTKNQQNTSSLGGKIDRGNNTGLLGGLAKALTEKDEDDKKQNIKPSPNPSQSPQGDTEIDAKKSGFVIPSLDEGSRARTSSDANDGIFARITKKIRRFFSSQQEEKPVVKALKKTGIADSYPNPTFKKADITDTKYQIPLVLLNDKTSPENAHIPSFDNHEEMKILFLMFQNVKNLDRIEHLKAMLDYVKNKRLINTQDQFGNTMLNYATRYNNIQAFYLLIDGGADPNICNKSGICPIHIAISNFEHDIFNILLQTHTKYDLVDRKGFDPLLYAIYHGNFYAFKVLMSLEPYRSKLDCGDMKYLKNLAKDGENVKIYSFVKDVILRQKCEGTNSNLDDKANKSYSLFSQRDY